MGKEHECHSPLNTRRVKRRRTRRERNTIRARIYTDKETSVIESENQTKVVRDREARNKEVSTQKAQNSIRSSNKTLRQEEKQLVPSIPNRSSHKLSEKDAFTRTLRRESNMLKKNAYVMTGSAMTTSRLTKRLGIFNNAKKSDKIHRAPVTISSEVKAKTTDDLQRVLDLTDAGLTHSADLSQLQMKYQLSQESDNRSGDQIQVISSCGRSSCSLPKTPNEVASVMETTVPRSRSPQILPKSADIGSIAKRISSAVKPSKTYPHRRYFQEKRGELSILLEQSTEAIAKDQAAWQDTMQLDSIETDIRPNVGMKSDNIPCHHDPSPSPTHGDPAPHTSHLTHPPQNTASTGHSLQDEGEYIDPQLPGMPTDALTNAKSFLACSELAVTSTRNQENCENMKMFCSNGYDMPAEGAGEGEQMYSGFFDTSNSKMGGIGGAGDGSYTAEMDVQREGGTTDINQMYSNGRVAKNYIGYVLPNVAEANPRLHYMQDDAGMCQPDECLSQSYNTHNTYSNLPVIQDHDYIHALPLGHQPALINHQRRPTAVEAYSFEMNPAYPVTYPNVAVPPAHFYRLQDTASQDVLDFLDEDAQLLHQTQQRCTLGMGMGAHMHHPNNPNHLTRVPRPPGPNIDHRSTKVNPPWHRGNMPIMRERPLIIGSNTPKLYPRRMY